MFIRCDQPGALIELGSIPREETATVPMRNDRVKIDYHPTLKAKSGSHCLATFTCKTLTLIALLPFGREQVWKGCIVKECKSG